VTAPHQTHPYYLLEPILSRHPDEYIFIVGALQMSLNPLDLVPESIPYGYLSTYLLAAGIGAGGVLNLIDVRPGDEVFYVDHPDEMAKMYLVGRLLSVLAGVGSVLLLYGIGKALRDHTTGALAALSLAITPLFVTHTHYLVSNVVMTFFMLLVILTALWMCRTRGSIWIYLLAGLLCGFVISNKPSGAVIFLVPLFVHFWLFRWGGLRRLIPLLLLVLGTLLGFIVTSPIYFLAPQDAAYRTSMLFLYVQVPYLFPRLLAIINALSWPVFLWLLAGGIYIADQTRRTRAFAPSLLLIWALGILPTIALGNGTFSRYAIPLMPPLALASAWLAVDAYRSADRRRWLALGLGAAALTVGFVYSLHSDAALAMLPIQDQVGEWAASNVPAGARVATRVPMYFYDPLLDNTRYVLQDLDTLDCADLPNYVLADTRQLEALEARLQLRYQERVDLGNTPRLPVLIPVHWGGDDWHYLLNDFAVLGGLSCDAAGG
jgi:hypothetical protein